MHRQSNYRVQLFAVVVRLMPRTCRRVVVVIAAAVAAAIERSIVVGDRFLASGHFTFPGCRRVG